MGHEEGTYRRAQCRGIALVLDLLIGVLLVFGRHINGDFSRNVVYDTGIRLGRCCRRGCCGFFSGNTRVLEATT
jgi:hypothetical protein